MHSTLTELLENMKSGLLWVHRDATVRYAGSDAGLRTGLGMSLVKEIVDLQDGRADVASTPGRGATVTSWLPPSRAAAALPWSPDAAGAVQ